MTEIRYLDDLLSDRAERDPGTLAVWDRAVSWTYEQLADRAGRWSTWLRDRDVRRGSRVVCTLENGTELAALVFGAVQIGAIVVPLSPGIRSFQLANILHETDPTVVVTTSDAGAAGVGAVDVRAATAELQTASPLGDRPGRISSDVALLMYTSGSTSVPKGVVCPHRSVVFAARAIAARLRYSPSDTVYCCLPFSFDYGLYQLFLSVHAGSQLGIATPRAAGAGLLKKLGDCGATIVPVVPTLASMVARLAARSAPVASPVRLFTNTGASLAPSVRAALRQSFPSAQLVLMFGLTECKRVTIAAADEDLLGIDSVGTALEDTEVSIRNASSEQVPAGTIGEIVVRGPNVMQGYWKAPELTAERFRRDPESGEIALHTGDYGWQDEEGRLFFAGRRDDLYKQNGMRVSATEIEAAASDVPGVRAAVLLPPDDERSATLVVATDLRPEAVLGKIGLRLEHAKVPPTCITVDELPLTTTGKVDRAAAAVLVQ